MNVWNCIRRSVVVGMLCILAPCPAAQAGLVFDITYDTSTMSGYNVTDVENAFNYAAQEYESAFTNNVHVNLMVQFGSTGLGASSSSLLGYASGYNTIVSALRSEYGNAPSAARTSAAANFPASDPTGGGFFWVTSAEAKALGLTADNTNQTDGTITFSNAASYTFDPNNRAVSGDYDFIGVAEHEISEVMGRIALTGSDLAGSYPNSYSADDLFRYTSNGALKSNDNGSGVYFSVDGGATDLVGFNNSGTNGGDAGDYVGSNATDPYNAFTSTNQAHSLTTADYTNLNVLGWDQSQNATVPEPSTLAMISVGYLLLFGSGSRLRASSRGTK